MAGGGVPPLLPGTAESADIVPRRCRPRRPPLSAAPFSFNLYPLRDHVPSPVFILFSASPPFLFFVPSSPPPTAGPSCRASLLPPHPAGVRPRAPRKKVQLEVPFFCHTHPNLRLHPLGAPLSLNRAPSLMPRVALHPLYDYISVTGHGILS